MTLFNGGSAGIHPAAAQRKSVAIIGSGISGLSCAWLLSQKHDVTVFERESWAGGHSNTVEVRFGGQSEEPRSIPVDTGFIVYNTLNYPNLTALFDHLNVPTKDSDMSFAASINRGHLEYSGTNMWGLFGQKRNIFRPRFWKMLSDIKRFYSESPKLLEAHHADDISLGDYMDANGYGVPFQRDHLLPMAAAIWSSSLEGMRDYPAAAFVRFFVSHGLLNITDRPQWRTVDGGSREYVKRLRASLAGQVLTQTAAQKISRRDQGVLVEDINGVIRSFDDVVLATHADEALSLLSDPDELESDLLGAFPYQENLAVLHSDASLMPRRKAVWSSWNYLTEQGVDGDAKVCVTYWMNLLQSIDRTHPLFVTLNPNHAPKDELVHREISYTHPVFDLGAMAAQRRLWELQGTRNTWFCGSYFGHGFHEDGLQSGLAVAEALGDVRRPWSVAQESGRIHLAPKAERAA